jgi:hypothetical protein
MGELPRIDNLWEDLFMKKLVAVFLFVLLAGSTSVFAGSVKTIDKDELKAMLGSSELVVVDVRTGRDWSSSEFKIKGAIRATGKDVDSLASQYSKDKTLVLYCA